MTHTVTEGSSYQQRTICGLLCLYDGHRLYIKDELSGSLLDSEVPFRIFRLNIFMLDLCEKRSNWSIKGSALSSILL